MNVIDIKYNKKSIAGNRLTLESTNQTVGANTFGMLMAVGCEKVCLLNLMIFKCPISLVKKFNNV